VESLVISRDYAQKQGEWDFWIGRKKEKRENEVLHVYHSHLIPLWTGLVASSPSSAICNHLQRQNHSMEFMEPDDISTLIFTNYKEIGTPYIEYRNHGK
jgi:hypothetical protein